MNSKELAKLIGVSQSTISRALNGSPQISEQRRQEIMELAKKHNFEFNQNARNLRNQTSNFVGILLPTYFSSFIRDDYRSIQFNYLYEELAKQDLDPILLNGAELFNDVPALERAIKKRQLAGLILWGRIENDEVIEYLKSLKIPIFAMTRPNEKMMFLPSVSVDSYGIGYVMGEHFAQRGYRRIGTIRLRGLEAGLLITRGFSDALMKKGVEIREEDVYEVELDYQAVYDLVSERIDRMRTYEAIFAQNDTMALGTLSALKDSGLSIPGDIAVAGNNATPVSQWCSPRLTTVQPYLKQQAELTCRRIVSMIREGVDPMEEKHCVIKPGLLVRESCP